LFNKKVPLQKPSRINFEGDCAKEHNEVKPEATVRLAAIVMDLKFIRPKVLKKINTIELVVYSDFMMFLRINLNNNYII
jgi:hypothetical protein